MHKPLTAFAVSNLKSSNLCAFLNSGLCTGVGLMSYPIAHCDVNGLGMTILPCSHKRKQLLKMEFRV